MFTIDAIKAAHSTVKSGADFPNYVQDLIKLGVLGYEHFVNDGHIKYVGTNGFTISASAKWEPMEVATTGSIEKLKHALVIHQNGQTNYPTFCKQSAEAGVEKWVLDMQKMTCIYYDKSGNKMVVETVPMP